MIPLFYGFDPREEVGAHAFVSSVLHHATQPVMFCPLHLAALPMYDGGQRDGTNAFIYSRFLVPQLMGWKGWAIFADGADMIVRDDIAWLWALRDPRFAVQVVQHDYKTKHPRKYVGTTMEAANSSYPRKNWSSLMLINCEHEGWLRINAAAVETMTGAELHRFSFLQDKDIGALPPAWNWLCQEYGPNDKAKLIHYSVGIPGFPHYHDTEMASDWWAAAERAKHAAA